MIAVIHKRHGDPGRELAVVPMGEVKPAPGTAVVRVSLTPVHRGDLLSVAGSPAFGDPVEIPRQGRVLGIEGMGRLVALADDVDPTHAPKIGARVSFFPAPGAWSSFLAVPAAALVALPDDVPDRIAAQLLVDPITARVATRAAREAAWGATSEAPVLASPLVQTSAGSSVARFITADLARGGIDVVRLVRSAAGAERLNARLPGGTVLTTEGPGWPDRVRDLLAGDPQGKTSLVFDGVGGASLGALLDLLAQGGTVISYGSLDGEPVDIRRLAPTSQTIRGVSVLSWLDADPDIRAGDVEWALDLARTRPELFPVDTIVPANDVRTAVQLMDRPGRDGVVLLDFTDAHNTVTTDGGRP